MTPRSLALLPHRFRGVQMCAHSMRCRSALSVIPYTAQDAVVVVGSSTKPYAPASNCSTAAPVAGIFILFASTTLGALPRCCAWPAMPRRARWHTTRPCTGADATYACPTVTQPGRTGIVSAVAPLYSRPDAERPVDYSTPTSVWTAVCVWWLATPRRASCRSYGLLLTMPAMS